MYWWQKKYSRVAALLQVTKQCTTLVFHNTNLTVVFFLFSVLTNIELNCTTRVVLWDEASVGAAVWGAHWGDEQWQVPPLETPVVHSHPVSILLHLWIILLIPVDVDKMFQVRSRPIQDGDWQVDPRVRVTRQQDVITKEHFHFLLWTYSLNRSWRT